MDSSRHRYEAYRERLAARQRGEVVEDTAREADDLTTKRHRSFWELLWAFLGLLGDYRGPMTIALITLGVATVLRLVPPAVIQPAVDWGLSGKAPPPWWLALNLPTDPFHILYTLAGGVVAISLTATAIHVWGRWEATRTVQLLQVALRKRVFEHAIHLPLHRIYELKSGGAPSMLREDVGSVSELVFSMVYNPFQAVIQLIGSFAVLAAVDWRLLLGGLLLLPIVYFTHQTWITWIRPLFRDIRHIRQDIDSQTTETYGGMRVVRTFNREHSEAERFVFSNHLMIRQQVFVWWVIRSIGVLWEIVLPIATGALLLYGGWNVLHGTLTIGQLTMFLMYLLMLLIPIVTLVNSATEFQSSLSALDRILDLLDEPTEFPSGPDTRPLDAAAAEGRVTFDRVSFEYPGSTQRVLHEIDLDVAPGETVALVGRSGSGKTTLCNLVARFYDPTEGALRIDGTDVQSVEVNDYRKLLGIVEQDVFLFDGTIRENIAYARRHALQEEVEQAARAAHAHEFIQTLTDGYETLIGERGVKLSGGQRQRLAIARAILADPKILILDEATSNLDTESERLIQASLRDLIRGRTCFIIAHRLSTISHADRIVVLDAGRIAEIGTHAELMEQSGRYRRMVELQLGADALADEPAS